MTGTRTHKGGLRSRSADWAHSHADLSKVSANGVGCHAEVCRDFAEAHSARVKLGGALHVHAAAVYGPLLCRDDNG
jgi:hypothetical protein